MRPVSPRARLCTAAFCALDLIENAARFVQQHTGFGEFDAPRQAPEELCAQLGLELADLQAERRLLDAQPFGRTGEMQFLRGGDLTTDTVLVHRDPRGSGYQSVSRKQPGSVLEAEALPGVSIPVASLFF